MILVILITLIKICRIRIEFSLVSRTKGPCPLIVINIENIAVNRIALNMVCKLNLKESHNRNGMIKKGYDFSMVGANASWLIIIVKIIRQKKKIEDSIILFLVKRTWNFLFQDIMNGVNKRTLVTLGIHQKNHLEMKF